MAVFVAMFLLLEFVGMDRASNGADTPQSYDETLDQSQGHNSTSQTNQITPRDEWIFSVRVHQAPSTKRLALIVSSDLCPIFEVLSPLMLLFSLV